MIYIKFGIENPWSDRFENIKAWAGKTFIEHKFWEVQIIKTNDLVVFDLRITAQRDHAGIDLWLGLFGYSINLQFYDNRHWDKENEKWMTYDES